MTKNTGSVRKLPSGKHQARRWDAARGTYVSLGTFSTVEEAYRELMRADIIAEAGYVPVSSVTKDHSVAAGREPFERYAERTLSTRYSSGAIQRSTFHKYNKLLQGYLIPTFGKMAVADIRVADVEKWWAAMDTNRNQRRGAYMVLSRLMKKALKDGLTKKNPCQVEASSRDHSNKRPTFTLEDVKLILLLEPDLQMRTLLWVLLGTGMRVGEALALDWQDVDLNEGMVLVNKHFSEFGMTEGTKGKKDGKRHLAVPQEVVDALLTLWQDRGPSADEPVFKTRAGKRMGYYGLLKRFTALRSQAGLTEMHIHDIRHVHLTLFGQHGTLADLMARAGHNDYRSAMRYQHSDADRQKKIVNQMTF
nr:tyrosine-type recombinase/integrase [Microbacterium testaceum]